MGNGFTPPVGAAPTFAEIDRNDDGDVSRREFTGTAKVFDKLDLDKDGFISGRRGRKNRLQEIVTGSGLSNARHSFSPARTSRVEHQLEGAVRLRPEQHLRAVQNQPPLPDPRVHHRDAPVQVLLPERPPAPQRRLPLEPRHAEANPAGPASAGNRNVGLLANTTSAASPRPHASGCAGSIFARSTEGGTKNLSRPSGRSFFSTSRSTRWFATGRPSWVASAVELPMARTVPPSSRNFFRCGSVLAAVMLPARRPR